MSRAAVEPPARLVEAARHVIASTAALAETASATQTPSERQAQKSEKERQRLREKKKRAKEKKKQEKAAAPSAVPAAEPAAAAAAAAVAEAPKAPAVATAAAAAPAEEARGKSAKKPKQDAVTDVLGEPLRAQLPKLLSVSEEDVGRLLERGTALAVVRNGTHVLAFAKADVGEEFVVVSNAVGPAVHLRKIVLQLQGENKEQKKKVLVPQSVAAELALATTDSFVQL